MKIPGAGSLEILMVFLDSVIDTFLQNVVLFFQVKYSGKVLIRFHVVSAL